MKCSKCGFDVGERVVMTSSVVKLSGEPVGDVHGTVAVWPEGRCHVVTWEETGLVTGLPNPNVRALRTSLV